MNKMMKNRLLIFSFFFMPLSNNEREREKGGNENIVTGSSIIVSATLQ